MLKDKIFLCACLGYAAGVFVGSFFMDWEWLFLLSAATWVAVAGAFPRKSVLVLVFPIGMFFLGIFLVSGSLDRFDTGRLRADGVSGMARVTGDPEERNLYRQTILRMESCETEYCPREKILWQQPLTSQIGSGARLAFSCSLTLPENFDPAFDYRMFLAKDGIAYVCRSGALASEITHDRRALLTGWLFSSKRAFEKALELSLPQPEAGLAEGLLLGGDSRLPDNVKEAFRRAGLTHIVAISGYNIALIAQGFLWVGLAAGLWRRHALWFAAAGIILFIFFVGAPPSAVRAGIMGVSVFAALFFGRLSLSVNILLGAAALMLLDEPLLLRYDVGFQLSFLAAFAIILALPLVQRMLPQDFFGKSAVEIALLTLAVELFVVPLLIYQFQSFSPFALLANVFLLPFVPYAMASAFVAGLAFLLLPGLHMLPAAIAYLFLRLITLVAEQISAWPGAALEFSIGSIGLFLWYAILIFAIVNINRYACIKRIRHKENS